MNTLESQNAIFPKGEKTSPDYFAGTAWLKMLEAEMKKKFLRGIVLYDGNEVIPFEKNLYAVPIQALWV